MCITVKTPPMRHGCRIKILFRRAMAIKLDVSVRCRSILFKWPLVCSCWPKKLRCRKLLRCEPSKLMKFKWFISEENVRCCCLGPFTKGCWERRILMREENAAPNNRMYSWKLGQNAFQWKEYTCSLVAFTKKRQLNFSTRMLHIIIDVH